VCGGEAHVRGGGYSGQGEKNAGGGGFCGFPPPPPPVIFLCGDSKDDEMCGKYDTHWGEEK